MMDKPSRVGVGKALSVSLLWALVAGVAIPQAAVAQTISRQSSKPVTTEAPAAEEAQPELVAPEAAPVEDADVSAQDLRMQAYSLFPGSASDKTKAIELFKQAAELGDGEAMAFLGSIYLSGDGVPADRAEAVNWYVKAVQAGNLGAVAKLAELAAADEVPAAEETAVPEDVAVEETEAAPDIEERVQEAIDLYLAGDLTPAQEAEVRATFEAAVENDHLEAKYWLADILFSGDWEEAERAFELMSEYVDSGGDEYGMAAIGRAYEAGNGVGKNLQLALDWFQRAVDNGYAGETDVTRIANLLAQIPPLPTATQPPSDRWGPFQLDGGYAAGIRNGSAYFAFGCLDSGTPYVEYKPADALSSALSGMDLVWVVMKTQSHELALEIETGNSAFYSFNDAAAEWMDRAAAANSISVAITGDLNNWNYRAYNKAQFTARGSAAAIRDLRQICEEVGALQE